MNCVADIFTRDFFAGVRVEEEGGVKQTSLQMCCLTEKKTDFLLIQQISYQATDFLLIQQISYSFNRFPSHSTDFLSNNRFPTHSFNIFYQTTDMLQSMILPSPLQTLHFLAIFQPLIFQNQQQFASKKVDFESLDSIPSMLSDRSDLAFQPGSSGHISDHMNRYKLLVIQIQRQILYFVLYKDTSPTT